MKRAITIDLMLEAWYTAQTGEDLAHETKLTPDQKETLGDLAQLCRKLNCSEIEMLENIFDSISDFWMIRYRIQRQKKGGV